MSSTTVCVGASDQADRPAPFSNRGAQTVDLAAPGTSITTDQASRSLFFEDFESNPANAAVLLTSYSGGAQAHHETYTAATTKVMPNMNMHTAATIRPVRMFLRASRRVSIGERIPAGARLQVDVGHHRAEQQREVGQ